MNKEQLIEYRRGLKTIVLMVKDSRFDITLTDINYISKVYEELGLVIDSEFEWLKSDKNEIIKTVETLIEKLIREEIKCSKQ